MKNSVSCPKYIALDTSTLGNLCRDFDNKSEARLVIDRFNSGLLVLYTTIHHILELARHNDPEVRQKRLRFLRHFHRIGFVRSMVEQSTIGGFFDLTALEAGFVLANPQTNTDCIVQAVAPDVRGRFSRGSEAVLSNQDLFAYLVERDPTPFLKHYTEWMSLERSFSPNREQRIPLPGEYSLIPQEGAHGAFKRIVETVAKQLAEHGDKQLKDPTGLAAAYFEKAIPYAFQAYQGSTSDPIFELLEKEWGVTRNRLPDEPTIQDVGDELIFTQHLSLIESRRGLTSGSLRGRIRKEQLPSWQVWSPFNRLLSRKPRVCGSDLGDLAILPFALYADAIQVDKRVHTDITQVRNS